MQFCAILILSFSYNLEENENLTEQNQHYIWLKNNTTPESFVTEKWSVSFDLRRYQIKRHEDIFKLWPILKQRIGSSLVSIYI